MMEGSDDMELAINITPKVVELGSTFDEILRRVPDILLVLVIDAAKQI